jgi:hypothetical protein
VESLTVVGSKRSGELRLKKLPALEALSFSSVESLAGVRYEARQSERIGRPELIVLTFAPRGTALVPARAARRAERGAPVLAAAASA